jgi:hypothetical protein
VSRRPMLYLPLLLAGLALPVAPALAGEDDGSSPTLHQSRNCVSDSRAKVAVAGDEIATVAFFVDGHRVKTVTQPSANGRFVMSMRCRQLSVGAHRARAVVTDTSGDRSTLRFTITRVAQGSPRFTG